MCWHTVGDYTIKWIENLSGGAYTKAFLGLLEDKKVVVKKYNLKDAELSYLIEKQYTYNRNIAANSNIRIPNSSSLIQYDSMVTLEDFVGDSVYKIVKNCRIGDKTTFDILNICEKIIMRMPEYIPLDTNPRNFVFDGNSIFFVDFMPPNPWAFSTDPVLRGKFETAFPFTKNILASENRLRRYFNKYYRLRKFFYYLPTQN